VFLLWLCAANVVLADDWNLKDKDGVQHKLSGQKGNGHPGARLVCKNCPISPPCNSGTKTCK
jgi:hypothetical protein